MDRRFDENIISIFRHSKCVELRARSNDKRRRLVLLYYSWAQSPGPSAAHSGRMCKLGSGRIDSYFDTSVAAVLTSGGTSYIGARADLSDTREWHGKCSDVIIFHDCLISDTDLIAIANGGVAMDELPFWRYRKFHFDGLYDPRVSSGATDLVSGIPVTTNGSGYGADIYDPPFVRRYSQQRNGKFFRLIFCGIATRSIRGCCRTSSSRR